MTGELITCQQRDMLTDQYLELLSEADELCATMNDQRRRDWFDKGWNLTCDAGRFEIATRAEEPEFHRLVPKWGL